MYTEYTSWSVPQHTFSFEHMTAHSVAHDQVVSSSFIVIPHAYSHPVSLMSLLNVKFTPFPSLFSSPGASSSRVSTSIPGRARSWCQSPDAPARWRESGRLVDSAPNTNYEPSSPTSPITRTWCTIRSTSPTTTQMSGAQTTSP